MSFYICRRPCPKEQGRRGAVQQRIRSIPGVLLPPAHHDWYCKPAKTTLSMVISVKPPSWIIEVAKCVFVPSIAWFISPVVIRSAASLHIRGRVPVRLSQNAPIRDNYVRPDGQPVIMTVAVLDSHTACCLLEADGITAKEEKGSGWWKRVKAEIRQENHQAAISKWNKISTLRPNECVLVDQNQTRN